ncbi:ribose-phosphate diphosphokinase [Marinobacter caseinilyticus]|uniref:ribose-phosphate diphosphokinase n=1 Tax=Marinobacter caseinilyticus TaxID=2692195 RepID=UPI001A93E8D0|nr:ribose-phosphate diphosphokinase [Marinobacter caseinilyticus]
MDITERPSSSGKMMLFSLDSGKHLLQQVSSHLGVIPGSHEERHFEGGEHKIRALDTVRGQDVYLVQSLYGEPSESVNDKLIKLLFFIGGLRDAGAMRVTLYAPYLCYMRKDRRTKFQDPLSSRYSAQLLEAVGLDRLVVFDVHNIAAFENAFRCRTVHLSIQPLLADYLAPLFANSDIVVASPDIGGAKRVELFRERLAQTLGRPVDSAFVEKYRRGGVVSGGRVVGDVAGRTVIILDDLIAGGTTMRRAAEAMAYAGASAVYGAATHGLFTENAASNLSTAALSRLITSNSVSGPALPGWRDRHQVLDISPLIAESINALSSECNAGPA